MNFLEYIKIKQYCKMLFVFFIIYKVQSFLNQIALLIVWNLGGSQNLQPDFHSVRDEHTPHLREIFKAQRDNVGENLTQLLHQMQVILFCVSLFASIICVFLRTSFPKVLTFLLLSQSLDLTEKRTVVLRGTPLPAQRPSNQGLQVQLCKLY